MDQKIIELAQLYDIEIKDTPGSIIIDKDGNERSATTNDVNIIFGLDRRYDE